MKRSSGKSKLGRYIFPGLVENDRLLQPELTSRLLRSSRPIELYAAHTRRQVYTLEGTKYALKLKERL